MVETITSLRKMSVVLLFATTSCGAPVANYDVDLEPYYMLFAGDMNVIDHSVRVKFVPSLTNEDFDEVYGRCTYYRNGRREVKISSQAWKHFTEGSKYWLMYHELGHCIMGLKHKDKAGIMYIYMVHNYSMDKFMKERELFIKEYKK
jgi:hypothetical protein